MASDPSMGGASAGAGCGVPGYAAVCSAAGRWVARPECLADIRGGAADALLAGGRSPAATPGRGRAGVIEIRLGGVAAIGKSALHGGLLGPVLRGIHVGPGRALAQITLAGELDRRGVRTPEVMAVGWRRVIGPLVRQAIVTRAVSGGRNLLEVARTGERGRRKRALAAAAAEVRKLHGAGFEHADLNLMNLVLEAGPDERVHIVDLDRGRFRERFGPAARLRGLARLARSHDKWLEPDRRLTPREEIYFLRRYCGPDRALVRRLLPGLRRSRARRRLLRRLGRLFTAS